MKNKREIEKKEKSIANAVASVEMDGGKIEEDTKELIRQYAFGEITLQECIDIIKKKYKT